jgi:integrase
VLLYQPDRLHQISTDATEDIDVGKCADMDRLDPPVEVTPHVLRHTYACMLRRADVSTEIWAGISGHPDERAMRCGGLKI